MASKEASGDIKAGFETLSNGAYLDLLLPRSNELDVLKLLRDASPEELTRIPSRRNLFFGTSIAMSVLDPIWADMK